MKSLSCESGKTNSCSNTSKNAVQYIAIKNNSCFCRFRSPDLRLNSTTFFEVGKWCKVKCYFSNHQIFSKDFFFEYFSEPSSLHFRLAVLSEAGAKVRQIFESPKDFGTFFKIFQNPFQRPGEAFFSRSGRKDKYFSGQLPNISRTFFLPVSKPHSHTPIRQQVSCKKFLISLQYHPKRQQ